MQPALMVGIVLGLVRAAADINGGIAGTVTDSGRPVASALVAATRGAAEEPATIVRTDAQGRFRLSPLPPGSYGVTATASGHTGAFVARVAVSAGATTRVPLRLGGAGVTVDGSVVDDATGGPLARASALAFRFSDEVGDIFAVEVQNGRYRVRLPRGNYGLVARAAGYDDDRQATAMPSQQALVHRLSRTWPDGPAPAAVVAWLRAQAIPLSTVAPEADEADLRGLGPSLADARVVAVGEATHGTRDFQRLRQRLLQWLVRERGFTVLAIEASMAAAFDLDTYVTTGVGDPQRALAALSTWTCDTEELLAVVRWLRRWNEDARHTPVRLYGIDMQYAPQAAQRALDFVARVAPDEAAALSRALAPLADPIDVAAVDDLSPPERRRLEAAIEHLGARFDTQRPSWSARTSARQWALGRQSVRLLEQFVRFTTADDPFVARDAAMADNVAWMLEHEGAAAKVMLWAHDNHVARGGRLRRMGTILTERLGAGYVSMGVELDRGSVLAMDAERGGGLREFRLDPLPPGTLDATLAATGLPRFAVDLRHRPEGGVVSDWLLSAHLSRDLGPLFSPRQASQFVRPKVAARDFDLIAFVAEATAVHLLPEGGFADATVQPRLVDGDFEDASARAPHGWTTAPQLAALGYTFEATTERPAQGVRCARLRRTAGIHYGEALGAFRQNVDGKPYRGQTLRLSARVRADGPDTSDARILLETSPPMKGVAARAEAPPDQRAVGREWRAQSVELFVPPTATTLRIIGALVGDGGACFDDMRLEVVEPF